jgi:octaprenyl-diphosphate synthase
MFVFLSASLHGEVNTHTYRAASLVEILHTATLIHDDVVDESLERRGFFSINALWKNKIAVLVGDYLLAKGLLLALDNREHDMLQYLSTAVKAMSEGELMQMEKSWKLDITEDVYYQIIRKKTASLIAAACMTGASSTTTDPLAIERMQRCGEAAGIAFQIKDDLLDFGSADIGKPHGKDIREKKLTLPVIAQCSMVDSSTKKWIMRTIKKEHYNPDKIETLIQFIRDNGGMQYAEQQMHAYAQSALGELESLPPSESVTAFRDLIDYTIHRPY